MRRSIAQHVKARYGLEAASELLGHTQDTTTDKFYVRHDEIVDTPDVTPLLGALRPQDDVLPPGDPGD